MFGLVACLNFLFGVLCPIPMSILFVIDGFNYGTIFGNALALFCAFTCAISIYMFSRQYFATCEFYEDYVTINPLFRKKYNIEYGKCIDVGIAYYVHAAAMTSFIGPKVFYIYLSYENVNNESSKTLWKTNKFTKIGYRKKTYDYLIEHMPCYQAVTLKNSYNDMKKNHKLKDRKFMW